MGIAMSNIGLSASQPDHTLGQYNGSKIRCKFVDGVPFLNATDMCQAAGKRWAKYWENKQTREFVEELGSGPNSDIIETSKTRGDLGGGTCNRKLRQRKPGQFWMMKASAFAHFQELLHETDQMLLLFTEVAR